MADKFCIDFDSAYTNIYKEGFGLVLSEPTVAAVDNVGGEVKAIGAEAYKLVGKTGTGTKTVFPVFENEIVNGKVATAVLFGFLNKVGVKSRFAGATALFSVPCGTDAKMIEKFRKTANSCGLSKVYFVESPLLSALGQRIPLNGFAPSFVIDMGGGSTGVAAVSLDGIIAGVSVNFGGNKINTDIIDYIAEEYGMQIGLQTAERIKNEIGSLEERDALSVAVNGRDLKDGTPRSFIVKASVVFECVKKYYDKTAEIAINVLKKLPPEVSAEIRKAGIYVSGAPSAIYGLKRYYENVFGMKVNVAENGKYVNALGGGVALGDSKILKKIQLSTK